MTLCDNVHYFASESGEREKELNLKNFVQASVVVIFFSDHSYMI